MTNTAHRKSVHPVRDYLNGLAWDGTERIDRWLLTYGKAKDTEYIRTVGAIVLMAAVRRIRQPGCKYDEMLVLESRVQGLNKSTALRALCPIDDWFSDDLPLNVDSKQVIERTLGKWIIEASDLAGKRKAEIEQLKSMLSRQVDGRHGWHTRASRWSVAGISSSSARRIRVRICLIPRGAGFWPVAVQRIDVDALLRD